MRCHVSQLHLSFKSFYPFASEYAVIASIQPYRPNLNCHGGNQYIGAKNGHFRMHHRPITLPPVICLVHHKCNASRVGGGGLRRASSSSLAPRRGWEIGFSRRWLKKAEMLSVLVQLGARQDVVIDFVYINNTP